MAAHRILVADDEHVIAGLIAELLRDSEYEVETVHDGRDAIRVASAAAPDLVITAIMMPHASGLDVLDALRGRAETRETPVILMSAAARPGIRDRNVRFIPKPFNIQSVLDAVSALLQPRPLHRSA